MATAAHVKDILALAAGPLPAAALLSHCTQGQLRALLAAGRLRRVVRGVYVDASVPDSPALRVAALRLVLPDRAVASHATALWLHGVEAFGASDVVEMVTPRGVDVAPRPGLRPRQAALSPRDVTAVGGVPVTTVARAVIDVARTRDAPEGLVAADAALLRRACTPQSLADAVERCRKLRNVERARLVIRYAEVGAESPMESRLRYAMVVVGGLPRPVLQLVVTDALGRFVARVDLGYPLLRIAVEFDGREAHLRSEGFVRERRRHNDLVRLGYVVLRYTAADVYGCPGRIAAELRDVMGGRAA